MTEGSAVAFCAHTTCALIINEWEDGALEDFRVRMLRLVPDEGYYAHDDLERRTQNLDEVHERRNGPAHLKAMLLSASSHAITGSCWWSTSELGSPEVSASGGSGRLVCSSDAARRGATPPC